ncbi:MAG: ATP-grasp domain-containing protein, partial [Phycisphaerae bacterium]
MKVHEYQGRALMEAAGIPVSPSEVISRPEQARAAFEKLSAGRVVVKAQVHAGGRGKAGYVKLVDSAEQAAEHAARMFAEPMVSKQTGPAGVKVRKIMLAAAVEIEKEYY